MLNLSQKKIIGSLLKLLGQNSFDDVTVKAVLADCKISRKTFYYHYADMTAVLKSAIKLEVNHLTKNFNENRSLCDDISDCCHYVNQRRTLLCNICNSSARGLLAIAADELLSRILTGCIRRRTAGLKIPDYEISIVRDFHKYALVGFFFEWLYTGAGDNARFAMEGFTERVELSICDMLKRHTEEIKEIK